MNKHRGYRALCRKEIQCSMWLILFPQVPCWRKRHFTLVHDEGFELWLIFIVVLYFIFQFFCFFLVCDVFNWQLASMKLPILSFCCFCWRKYVFAMYFDWCVAWLFSLLMGTSYFYSKSFCIYCAHIYACAKEKKWIENKSKI